MVVKSRFNKPVIVKFAIKSALGAAFFIVGFNFSNTLFFHQNPLFGVPFLAEVLISITLGMFGFHTVPILAMLVKDWIERLITKTISEIVGNFWDQQSRRMEESRRNKQKRKKEDIDQKLKEVVKGGVLIDTSVLIDGRISDVIKTGFIFGSLLVIPSVVSELHTLSDSADELKRAKGRRGLDILKSLKSEKKVKLEVLKEDPSGDTVDDKLITLGRKLRGQVMTMDFNLNKVAAVKGVSVLNLNELINALKTAVLPHEILTIQVKSHGKGKNQGVGYLPDGTMVVVEDGAEAIGKSLKVVVLRVIQTAAGKMIFARLQE